MAAACAGMGWARPTPATLKRRLAATVAVPITATAGQRDDTEQIMRKIEPGQGQADEENEQRYGRNEALFRQAEHNESEGSQPFTPRSRKPERGGLMPWPGAAGPVPQVRCRGFSRSRR